MDSNRILAIDPSGTGTTGIYFRNGKKEEFSQYQEKDWVKHYNFISQLVKAREPHLLLFEDTNYIHKRSKDGLNLFRLLGALECLSVPQIERVNVLEVKKLTKQLFHGAKKIAGLEYLPGRGKG